MRHTFSNAIKHIVADSGTITPSDQVQNLGVIFDSTMDPEAFINQYKMQSRLLQLAEC